ncbi:MAG: MBL fold metallo-hydrolase [Clostridia bacterium]|nr:MBL fold metallo-hydrolase [Clostridia bacterium]
MNKFKFRGVGQGLFYTGSLMHGTYNFVYDCGSESRNFYLKKQIEEYIEEMRDSINTKPHIDFIVVSHLHKDHINGIYDLLTKCSVDKLYLPYIMGDDTFKRFVLAYIAFYDLEGKNNNDFGDNIEEDNEQRRRELYKILKTLYGIEENRLDINTQVIITGENNATAPIEFCFPNNKKKYWEFKIFQRHLNEEIISDLNF